MNGGVFMKKEKLKVPNKVSNEYIAKEVLNKIFELVNSGINVELEEDMGEGTITVYIGKSHTHCGFPGATSDELIKSLHDTLIKNRGLSFVNCSEYQVGEEIVFKDEK